MTKNPACCTPDSTLQEVAHMMEMYDCGCIPVIENHQMMRPVGTITDRDITIRTFSANKNPVEMKASDIMTSDIATVTPDTSVEDCMNVMESKQIRRVLVVDKNGRCTGIVAQADLAEHATHPAQTAHFIREVSESDQSNDRSFDSNRSQFNERRMPEQNNYSFSQNQSDSRFRGKRHQSSVEKESFFNSKTLLTLLGSIGLGAGLKYYLGQEDKNKHHRSVEQKVKTYNLDTKNKVDKASVDLSIPTPTASVDLTKSSITPAVQSTKKTDTFSSVDSFDKTNDDNDLKPITEVGRTAGNT